MRLTVSARSRRASVGRPGVGGQRLLVGPRQPEHRQRLVDLAGAGRSQPSRDRQAASAARADGSAPAGPASSDSDRAVGRDRLVRLARPLEQGGHGRQAPADVDRHRGVGPRLGRHRLPRRQHRPVRRQSVLGLRPTFSVSSASSKFACASARREAEVGLLAQQRAELAVEVGRRLQEPVAQRP